MSIPKQDERTPEPVVIEIIEGVAGSSLYINDQRVAGPKPWAGGRAVNRFEIAPDKIDQACNAYGSTDALRSALAPFAKAAERYDDPPGVVTHDNVELWQDGRRIDFLTVGDLRKARAALSGSPEGSPQPVTDCNQLKEALARIWAWADDRSDLNDVLAIIREEVRVALSGSPAPSTEGLREALEKIEGGSFPGASTLAINGDWKGIVDQLQSIARTALAGVTAPQEVDR